MFSARTGLAGLCALLSTLFIIGCSEKNAAAPAPRMDSLFTVTSDSKIRIARSALEKGTEFLLQGAMIQHVKAPLSKGIKSRVVSFRLRGAEKEAKVYLVESPIGHTVTPDLPPTLLLAEFPVTASTDDSVTFDFNAGMSRIFNTLDWVARGNGAPDYENDTGTLGTNFSYLESARFTDDNQLYLRQITQISVPGRWVSNFGSTSWAEGLNDTVEVRYYLGPYRPDPSFKPSVSPNNDRVGFFEVAPQLARGGLAYARASKFNHLKPITYAVSANTPPEFRQAVRDGILYWNKAIPGRPLRVIDAPEGVTAPDPRYNIVQWVPWDQDYLAYADSQMDPRTGEILHAQVYFKSSIALQNRLKTHAAVNASSRTVSTRVSLRGFDAKPLCEFGAAHEAAEGPVGGWIPDDFTDAQILKVTQDFVRYVTAHEVGHTLGLRHNFAGSLAANGFKMKERRDVFLEYVRDGRPRGGITTTSSAMEYLPLEEGAIAGHQVATAADAFAYDQVAMDILYGMKDRAGDLPAFCTDKDVGAFSDCNRYDAASNSVEYASWYTEDSLAQLPHLLVSTYLNRASPPLGGPGQPVEQLMFAPSDNIAKILYAKQATFLNGLVKNVKFLEPRLSFPVVDYLNLESVQKEEFNYFERRVDALGGVAAYFTQVPADYTEQTTKAFAKLLERDIWWIAPGMRFRFTALQKRVMETRVAALLKAMKNPLALKDIESVAEGEQNKTKLPEHAYVKDFAEIVGKKAEVYGLSESGESIDAKIIVVEKMAALVGGLFSSASAGTTGFLGSAPLLTPTAEAAQRPIRLPKFTFSLAVRKAAIELLAESRAEDADWTKAHRTRLKEQLKKRLDAIVGGDFSKLKGDYFSTKEAKTWFEENEKVLKAF